MRTLISVLLTCVTLSFAAQPACAQTRAPFIRVLGTVQDGGLPHAGCTCVRCIAARSDPAFKHFVASLALVTPDAKRGWQTHLIDATPDITAQIHMLEDVRVFTRGRVDRTPVDSVLLTHAHMGHYFGLARFGFEAVHTRNLPVRLTPRFAAFLHNNGPWSQLVDKHEVRLIETSPGDSYELDGLRITPITVPHRDEYSDTVGYRIAGPHATVLYVPDTDGWSQWPAPLLDALGDVDVAILDGTFYSMAELPGRDIDKVRHPLMTQTMDLLQEAVNQGRLRVIFTHLNHTNPALSPSSPERHEIERRGFEVAAEGIIIPL